jgi:hypothetical protein
MQVLAEVGSRILLIAFDRWLDKMSIYLIVDHHHSQHKNL